jgi:hypothetical protein
MAHSRPSQHELRRRSGPYEALGSGLLQVAPHIKRTKGGSLNDRAVHPHQKVYVRSAPTVRGSMTEIR